MTAPKTREDVQLLLVQIRKDQTMKLHEITCFETSGNLSDSQVHVHDLLEDPLLLFELDNVHGVIIGGSGDYSVLDDVPNLGSLEALILEAHRRGLPILGCCWGHQLLGKIFGGKVVRDPEHREVGSIIVHKSAAAAADPLFSRLPGEFHAQAGHNDRVSELPTGAVLLASSDKCPIQAFTLPGTGIYGVQFHPELGREDLMMRLNYYTENYVADLDSVEKIKGELKETNEAAAVVGEWVDRVILKK